MAQDQRGQIESDQNKQMSPLEAKLTWGVIVMFLLVGVISSYIVLTVGREELLGGAIGPRAGFLELILGTPLRFLMPFVFFGLAGWSYVYLQKHGPT